MADYYAQRSIYHPDPYQTTVLPRRFPEHHYPFDHARHAVSQAFRDMHRELNDFRTAEQALISPRVDVHETKTTFYIDVELPGVRSQERMTLKWIDTRSLLFGAMVDRPPIPEDKTGTEQTREEASTSTKAEVAHDQYDGGNTGSKSSHDSQPVFMTIGERPIGKYGRAFNFPVDVDHERSTVNLDSGLLRIIIPKLEDTHQVDTK